MTGGAAVYGIVPALPFLDLILGRFLRDAVALLDAPHELIALAIVLRDLIFRQLSPLLLHFACTLRPIAFDLVPIHSATPCSIRRGLQVLRRGDVGYWNDAGGPACTR